MQQDTEIPEHGRITLRPPTGIGQVVEVTIVKNGRCKILRLVSEREQPDVDSYHWAAVVDDFSNNVVGK